MSFNHRNLNAPRKFSTMLKNLVEKPLSPLQFMKHIRGLNNNSTDNKHQDNQQFLAEKLLHLQHNLGQSSFMQDESYLPTHSAPLQHFKSIRRQSSEEYRKQKDMLEFDSLFNRIDTPEPPKKDILSKITDTLSFQGKMSIKIDLNLDGG